MLTLPLLSGKKFILTIGDDGAVLTFLDKKKLLNKFFAASAAISDRREINALLLKNPNVPIYVLLDSIEQTYTKQTLPAISIFSIGKLVKRRLERDFAKSDIKGAISLGRDTKGRKDWIYMFISTPTTQTIIDWIEYLSSLENNFGGIHLLPLEMENIIKDINKRIFKKDNPQASWQFLVTHNKTGGFRQTILYNERIIFTRLIRSGKDSMPDIIAGNIEQEIINTIDYLRRLGFSEEDSMDLIVVVSKELKHSLATTRIRGKSLLLFTPFEIANELGYESVTGKEDKFADILLATIFANNTHILKLPNPRAKQVDNLLLLYKFSSVSIKAIMPVLIIYICMQLFQIITLRKEINEVEDKKAKTEKEWKDIKNIGQYGVDDANKITDAISLRKRILDERSSPIDLLVKLANLNTDFTLMQSFTWSNDKDYSNPKAGRITSLVNVEFSTKSGSIDEMFQNYDMLSGKLNENFKDFQLDISKLPDQITFENKKETIPIQIRILSKEQVNPPIATPTAPAPHSAIGNIDGEKL